MIDRILPFSVRVTFLQVAVCHLTVFAAVVHWTVFLVSATSHPGQYEYLL